jgi:2-oxoglutarate ferredoxin oxidoreductase subunit beta
MTTATPIALTRKDFVSSQEVKWCPGCGDYSILAQVQRTMPDLGVPKENIVFISGIGCSSRFPYYMNTYGMHTIHGRAPAIASGLALARPDLKVFVVTGDGDALSIGGNHIIHAMRRNIDLTVLMFNNRIYGLTKGQVSPTSELGKVTKSTPLGSIDRPFEPSALVLGADATFVARVPDNEVQLMQQVIKRASEHKGVSFVEILQNCPVFNDGAYDALTGKDVKAEKQVVLQHGKPLLFKNGTLGIRVNKSYLPEVVEVGEGSGKVPASECIIHDEAADSPALAAMLAHMRPPAFPLPVGILRDVRKPTLSELLSEVEQKAIAAKGPGKIEDLWRSGDVWTVTAQSNGGNGGAPDSDDRELGTGD